MAQKDYYETLGIPKNASEEDVKAAYKRLAKEYHPDVAQDKVQAEKKFKEINEAYQVLSDPHKKQMYDTYGTANPQAAGFGGAGAGAGGNPFEGFGRAGNWGPFTYTYSSSNPQAAGAQGFGDVDPFDIFEQVFGFRDFGGGRRQRKGRDLHFEMAISFANSVRGMEDDLMAGSKKLRIKIPAGVRDGNQIRFEGQGDPAKEKGLPNGDLYVTIRVQQHRIFQRHGDDVYIVREVSFVDATLGAEVEIPVVDPESVTGESTTKMKIPAGTQPDTEFRIKGKGMPRLHTNSRGDLYVRVFIKIPDKISKDQRKKLEEYKAL